jgi:two-component system, chemotaxis family, sensor kinase CheA
MKAPTLAGYFDQYRDIVFALGYFLVFDLGVLLLSIYIAFQLSEDALRIKLARQSHPLAPHMTTAQLTEKRDAVCEFLSQFGPTVAVFAH